ncbi:MAG: YceD family protein [Thermodesulfobacteriota bacterium]
MFTLKLDEIPEEGLELKWTEEKTPLVAYLKDFSRIDFDFETPLQSEVKIRKAGRSILIAGKVETTLRLDCVRCLKEFSYPLSTTFELALHPLKEAPAAEETELGSEEMEASFFEGGEIHLSEIACEQIFLEIPYQPVCQEGCKGLCPSCGQDLNLSSCGCVKQELTTSFSDLKKLKLD